MVIADCINYLVTFIFNNRTINTKYCLTSFLLPGVVVIAEDGVVPDGGGAFGFWGFPNSCFRLGVAGKCFRRYRNNALKSDKKKSRDD